MPFQINITPLAFQKLGILPDPDKERKAKEKEQKERLARLAGALTPDDQGQQYSEMPGPVGSLPALDVPPGPQSFAPPGVDPEQYRMSQSSVPQKVRAPQFSLDMLQQGYSPGSVLDVYKSLPVEAQPDFQRIIEQAKLDYALKGPDAVLPALRDMIEREMTPKENWDPLSKAIRDRLTGNPELADQAADYALGLAARPSSTPTKPLNLKTPADVYNALRNRQITQDDANQRLADFERIESQKQEKAKDVKGELRSATESRIEKLKLKLADYKTEEQWKALSDTEKKTYRPLAGGWYYRDDPAVMQQLEKEYDYLGDVSAIEKSTDSTMAARGMAPTPGGAHRQQMADVLTSAGFSNVDPNDPNLEEDYKFWMSLSPAEQDAILKQGQNAVD